MELTKLTLVESIKHVKEKKCSASELVSAYVKRIEKSDKLNCFNTKDLENAVSKAKKIDANKKLDKSLVGAPIAVKDLFCTKGVKTTASSKILSNFIPTYESTVTEKLWSEDAILIGKLNSDEFAMGSSNETSNFGNVLNPYRLNNENLVPGGSSGGCASAVAADLTSATVGTDTGEAFVNLQPLLVLSV